MDALTVRRWVEEPVEDVWRRVTDLDGLVTLEPSLELVDLEGCPEGRFDHGTVAVLSKRHGPRIVTLELSVVAMSAPDRLVLTLVRGSDRWVIATELVRLAPGVTDVAIHARRDPAGLGSRLPVGGTRMRVQRRSGDLAEVLDALGRAADGTASRSTPSTI